MACSGERFSNAVIERIRADFVKAVRTVGVNITYQVMDSVVSWGSGLSGVAGVEQDPLYSQPAYPVSAIDESKSYSEFTVMTIVNASPTKGDLREAGLRKEADIMVTIAALTLEAAPIVPNIQSDRVTVAAEEYDIIETRKDWLVEGDTNEIKNLCWVMGCVKRQGRV